MSRAEKWQDRGSGTKMSLYGEKIGKRNQMTSLRRHHTSPVSLQGLHSEHLLQVNGNTWQNQKQELFSLSLTLHPSPLLSVSAQRLTAPGDWSWTCAVQRNTENKMLNDSCHETVGEKHLGNEGASAVELTMFTSRVLFSAYMDCPPPQPSLPFP